MNLVRFLFAVTLAARAAGLGGWAALASWRAATRLALVLLALPAAPVAASWKLVSFEARVCGTEAIVIGEVSDIKRRTVSVTFHGQGGYTTWYDDALLKDVRVLKDDGGVARTYGKETTTALMMFSAGQDDHPFSHMNEHYPAGTKGIWFLSRDSHTGSYRAGPPDNPLPISDANERKISSALGDCERRR